MQFIRLAVIPLICVVCVALAIYLVLNADKRWERERLGLPSEQPADTRSEVERPTQDASPPQSHSQQLTKDSETRTESDAVNETTKTLEKPASETAKKISPDRESPPDSTNFSPKNETAEGSESAPRTVSVKTNAGIKAGDTDPKSLETTDIDSAKNSTDRAPTAPADPIAAAPSVPPLDETSLKKATIAIVSFRRTDDSPIGCGVIVSIDENGFDVLTASHLFSDPDPFTVTTFDRDTPNGVVIPRTHRSAKIHKQSPSVDLAIVRVQTATPPREMLRLAVSEPTAGEESNRRVWAIYCDDKKNPQAEAVSVVNRQNAKRTKDSALVSYWRIERPSAPGWSGSALIDQRGQLIGIASGNSKGIAYYCDEKELSKFLTE